MNTITVNGKVITAGRNITIKNGKIIVDGTDVTPDSKTIHISIVGDLDKLQADVCDTIKVSGNVNILSTMSGDVEVEGAVTGSITTMSGDVDCGVVGGSISTMSGDVKNKK